MGKPSLPVPGTVSIEGTQMTNITAGNKSLLASTSENHHTDIRIFFQLTEQLFKTFKGGHSNGVESLGIIESNRCQSVLFFEQQVCIRHHHSPV